MIIFAQKNINEKEKQQHFFVSKMFALVMVTYCVKCLKSCWLPLDK